MDRRQFIATAATAAAGAAFAAGTPSTRAQDGPSNRPTFRLKYAPHFGMFNDLAGDDPIDQLKFAADQGFTAWEDNGMMGKPVELQERIARTLEDLGMTMGVFVSSGGFDREEFTTSTSRDLHDRLRAQMKKAVEVGKRMNATWSTFVPGNISLKLERDYQMANAIENLHVCAEVCEPAGLVLVLEPLNWWANHPGLFLTEIPQAYLICKGVNSPSVKILDDLYHQQISEGNLIPNIDKAWSEIAYFQIGDNPGRKEPTTGEINYRNIFRHIHDKGYDGVMGMEHGVQGSGKEGEQALIEAYRWCDSF
jgi:hydroxypyruvate isomerase